MKVRLYRGVLVLGVKFLLSRKKTEKYVKVNLKLSRIERFLMIWTAISHGKACHITNCLYNCLQKEHSTAISCLGNHKGNICFTS